MKINTVTDVAIKPTAEKIIASMKAQLKNPKTKQRWERPFNRTGGSGKNAATNNYYKGCNAMLTAFDAYYEKYPHAIYATKKQCKKFDSQQKFHICRFKRSLFSLITYSKRILTIIK